MDSFNCPVEIRRSVECTAAACAATPLSIPEWVFVKCSIVRTWFRISSVTKIIVIYEG